MKGSQVGAQAMLSANVAQTSDERSGSMPILLCFFRKHIFTRLRLLSLQVASEMAKPASEFQVKETVPEIERSCRADLAHFPDPTVQLQLQLQLAITAERYSEASRCKPASHGSADPSLSDCPHTVRTVSAQSTSTLWFDTNQGVASHTMPWG